jgi:HPt (histidine-containing phosphotransfer) domain-containing protein
LEQAIQSSAAKEVRQLSHKLRGASSSLGIVAVVPPLARLEEMGQAGQLAGATEAFTEVRAQLGRIRQFLDRFLLQAA